MNSQTVCKKLFYCISRAAFNICFVILLLSLAGVVPAQRAIVNPSIEDPAFPNASFVQAAEGTVPGWLTSHPVQPGACGGADCRPIERWSTGFTTGITFLPATGAGLRWAELNAFTNSMIYQSVCMTNGESFGYSFVHRGRDSAATADVAQFRLGIPTGLPAGSKPANTYDIPIATVRTENDGGGAAPTAHPNATVGFVAGGNGWRRYSGTFAYSGTTQVVNLGFVAISTAGGVLASGNLIDDWQVTLNPYVEFSPAAVSGNEGTDVSGTNTPANRPAIRIGGSVTAPIVVTFQITGGTATIGTDYSLTVPFQLGNTTPTATVTIPIGTYDGTSAASLFPIPFSIRTEGTVEADETVTFNLTSAPGATIASIGACGTPPVVNSTYTILNDDILTAGNVAVAGRVLDSNGRGVRASRLVLTDMQGNSIETISNAFGYYRFNSVPSGEAYVLTANAKRHLFNSLVVAIEDEIAGLDIVAID
jgi:hypothetical protein